MRLRVIVFDWDGTLMDSEAVIVRAMSAAYREHDLEPPAYAAIRHQIGLSLDHAIAGLTPALTAAAADAIAAAYRRHYAAAAHDATLFPGVRDALVGLRANGYDLAVATGKSRAGLARVLAATDLDSVFAASRTADDCEPKPAPAMLQEILAELDAAPAEAIMIGDTTFDLAMAAAVGAHAAGVSYGAHDVERLRAFRPAFVLDRFTDIASSLGDFERARALALTPDLKENTIDEQ